MIVHRRCSAVVGGTLFLVVLLVVVRQYVTKPWRSGTAAVETRMSATQLAPIAISRSAKCCALINENLQLLCNESRRDLPANNTGVGCTCADYLYCRLAVVTAISSNHFREVQDMIHSAQKNAPNTKIFVYDLGLKEHERKHLSEYCHVEVRSFPFDKYPPHFRALSRTEAWKPVIINEIAKEYDVVLYGDASLRILKPVKDELLPYLMEFPFIAGPTVTSIPVIAVTPPEMYNYLRLNLTRMQALKAFPGHIQSTMMCIWTTKMMKDKFLKYWIDCAMHEECMSPKGYKRYTACHLNQIHQPNYRGEFVGCMRCQSIVNFLLYREFGAWEKVQHPQLMNVWTIKREITHMFKGNFCSAAEK